MSTTTLPAPGTAPTPSPPLARRARALLRGRAEDASWVRPALIALLVGTAIAYLWNLTASGNANSFYAAAVQAGTKSWKALLFGSIDPSNFITVDKPPASTWVMALSGTDLRLQQLQHAGPAGARGRRRGRAALRLAPPLVQRRHGPARRARCSRSLRWRR